MTGHGIFQPSSLLSVGWGLEAELNGNSFSVPASPGRLKAGGWLPEARGWRQEAGVEAGGGGWGQQEGAEAESRGWG